MLIDYDVEFTDRFMHDIKRTIEMERTRGRALGVSDEFMYTFVQALQSQQKYEYKVMHILLCADLIPVFRDKLLSNEPFAGTITMMLKSMFMDYARGRRLDGQLFPVKSDDMQRHLRSAGHFVHTFRNMYLAWF